MVSEGRARRTPYFLQVWSLLVSRKRDINLRTRVDSRYETIKWLLITVIFLLLLLIVGVGFIDYVLLQAIMALQELASKFKTY